MISFLRALAGLLKIGNPIKIFSNFYSYRYLIDQMIRRDIGQRYRGSFLGIIWAIINPLVMLLIYTFVFSIVFNARWKPTSEDVPLGEFAITLFAGLIPFNLFAEVANRSPGIVLNFPNYVKKVVFPLEILPIVAVGTALFTSLVSIGILEIASLLFMQYLSPTVVFLPLVYIPLIFLSLGFGWFLASLGVYVRDIVQAVPLIMQVLLFMSPILYPIANVPENLKFILAINPLTMIVEDFRNVLIWGDFFPFKEWLVWTILSMIIAMLGYLWFIGTKKGFADVL